MDEQTKNTRRRGEILEEAILKAAWEELTQIGYANLSMESVAARAGTNKAVLYRRWANKSILAMAAIRKYIPKITDEIPDTGSLRGDLYDYLEVRLEPVRLIGIKTLRGLLSEPHMWQSLATAVSQMGERKSDNKITAALTAILKNAEKRGEIRMESLTPRIIALPFDLLRNEIFSMHDQISDEIIAEIVDDIFLPLVYAKSGPLKP